MKKLLIGLTVLFSFIFVSNVSAATLVTTKYSFSNDYNIILNTYGLSEEEITSYTNKYIIYNENSTNKIANQFIYFRNYYETNLKDKYDYYLTYVYIINGTPYYYLYAFNENSFSYNNFTIINSPYSNMTFMMYFGGLGNDYFNMTYSNNSYKSSYPTYTSYLQIGNSNSGTFDVTKQSIYYETNYSIDITLSSEGVNNKVYDSFIYDNKTYYPGNFLFNTLENNDLNNIKPQGPVEPELKYKTGFTSSEAYSVLGKVSNNFKFIDNDFILNFKNYKFKLQFGANDFLEENIPVFSHFKLYGRYSDTDTWHSMDEYFNNNYVNLEVLDTTYDYSEGMLADASITIQLNFNYTEEDFNILYNEFKIEFYFDNTQNGYIYCFDNLNTSTWEDTSKFLEDYIYYYFPSNYKYAYIVNKDKELNEGKIYFPTNSINNKFVKIQGQYYNYTLKSYGIPLLNNLYKENDYYSYIDFSFNNKSYILSLNRIKGSYYYKDYYSSNQWQMLAQTFIDWNIDWSKFNYSTLNLIEENEITYFYAPIGYDVYFSNGTDITDIVLPNGNISIDNNNINNNYEVSIDDNKDLFDVINKVEVNNNILYYFTNVYNMIRKSNLGTYVFIIIVFSILLLIFKASKR